MTNRVDHIRGSVHPLKLMLKAMFAIQIAHGAKVIFIALHTLPADTSDSLLCTSITYHIMVPDTWRRIINCFIVICSIYLRHHFPNLGSSVIATVDFLSTCLKSTQTDASRGPIVLAYYIVVSYPGHLLEKRPE